MMKAVAAQCFAFVDGGICKAAVIGQPVTITDKAVYADLLKAGFIVKEAKTEDTAEKPEE